jgi:hypothetical protein
MALPAFSAVSTFTLPPGAEHPARELPKNFSPETNSDGRRSDENMALLYPHESALIGRQIFFAFDLAATRTRQLRAYGTARATTHR